MAQVLVTGFEPFGSNARNISMEVLSKLPRFVNCNDPWKELRESELPYVSAEITTMLLSVDELGSNTVANLIESGSEWDFIVHVGLCESCTVPRIETRAQNKLDMRIPDNAGRHLTDVQLSMDGDLHVQVPVRYWHGQNLGMDWEPSVDAGTFICNETLYRTLHALTAAASSTPCLFLHLPDIENCSLEQASAFIQNTIQRMLFRPVVSVVGGLLSIDDRFLVARRALHESYPGKWEFPGGKVEPGESLQEAIIREFSEEFAWDVSAQPPIGRWYHGLEKVDICLEILPLKLAHAGHNLNDSSTWTAHDAIAWRSTVDDTQLDWLGSNEQIVHWMRATRYVIGSK